MKTIIEMAQDAGFWREHINTWMCRSEDIERFAELVRAEAQAEEREACVGLRKEIVLIGGLSTEYEEGFWDALKKYEDAIRARGNT